MTGCNETFLELSRQAVEQEVPISGRLRFHDIAVITAGSFAAVAVVVTAYLMIQHAVHYSRPWEQRHILRIVAMIPIYAVVSFISFLDYRHAIYYEIGRDCYEALAISSFFALLCGYVDTNLHDQKEYFRRLRPRNWMQPIGWLQRITGGPDRGPFRVPRSGLTWFNVIWLGVFQYCVIRVSCTLAAIIAQAVGRYCVTSLSPSSGHVWIIGFISISVTVAMFCLIQFYFQLRDELAEHGPFVKVLVIKLVVFFSFWQGLVISILAIKGPLKPTPVVADLDIRIGMPATLLCVEMAAFSILLLWAFPYRVYSEPSPGPGLGLGQPRRRPAYQGGLLGHRAFIDAFNIWDIVKACARALRWIFVGFRKRETDVSYHPDRMAALAADDDQSSRQDPGRPQSVMRAARSRSRAFGPPMPIVRSDSDPKRRTSSDSSDSFAYPPTAADRASMMSRHSRHSTRPQMRERDRDRDRDPSRGRTRRSGSSASTFTIPLPIAPRPTSVPAQANNPAPSTHRDVQALRSEEGGGRPRFPSLPTTPRPSTSSIGSTTAVSTHRHSGGTGVVRARSNTATSRRAGADGGDGERERGQAQRPVRSQSQSQSQPQSQAQSLASRRSASARRPAGEWPDYDTVDISAPGGDGADGAGQRFSFRRTFTEKN